MKTRPYSNSTSDDLINFYDDWCLHCQHDAAWRAEEPLREAGGSGNEAGCEILLASGCFQIDDPNYPPEWIEDDVEWPTPSNPRCTAFKPIDDEEDQGTYVADPRQGDLFERGTRDYRLITFVPGVRRRR